MVQRFEFFRVLVSYSDVTCDSSDSPNPSIAQRLIKVIALSAVDGAIHIDLILGYVGHENRAFMATLTATIIIARCILMD